MKTYVIETCHINGLVNNEWKKVDNVAHLNDLSDYLRSPVFEWSSGTCARARTGRNILYEWIFNDRDAVDVSAGSEVMKKYPFDASSESLTFALKLSALNCWVKSPSGSWLLEWLTPILTRRECVKVCYELAKFAHPYYSFNYQPSRKIIEELAYWLEYDDAQNEDEIRRLIPRSINEEYMPTIDAGEVCINRDLGMAIAYATQCARSTRIVLARHVSQADALRDVRDIVRNNLPFHEIALRLIA